MKKRDLFKELHEGIQAMDAHRQHKITLRTHTIESQPSPTQREPDSRDQRAIESLERYQTIKLLH